MTHFEMPCQKCKVSYPEKLIDVSHDVPKYTGGTDADGSHNLCRECHDIYERIVASVMFKTLNEEHRVECRDAAKRFANSYFREVKKGD
jgi:hypothetical protein